MHLPNTSLLSSLVALALVPAVLSSPEQRPLLPPLPVLEGPTAQVPSPHTSSPQFTLRHVYHSGSHRYPGLLRKVDIHPDTVLAQSDADDEVEASAQTIYNVATRPTLIHRMADRSLETINDMLEEGRWTGRAPELPASAWTIDEIAGPNMTDKATVLSFALMALNAYILTPHTEDWEDVKGGFNYTEDFGWEEDGLRGHIFADTKNSTIVIALKGTSMAIFDGADTTGHDKDNDNLFASCCCGQGGQYFWKQVCDCQTSAYTCNNTCLAKALREKSHYYHAAMDLYANVTLRYPNADVWLSGHSLGGVASSLLGLTFGLPTVTFEAFPDALAASRLGLPTPPGYHIGRHQGLPQSGIYHFGHTADPIFMGTCNAASSACTIAGYAMQSQCHTGNICVYDTVKDLGWRPGVGTHRIVSVVRDVIRKYDDVPRCETDDECVDCFSWKFYESNGTETTTTSKPTSTLRTSTRTATCKTPGWWGCLDETTSSPVTQTSTVTTTTCIDPGWFGCREGATTTITTTITTNTPVTAPSPSITTVPPTTSETKALPTPTTSCASKGWFGCKDKTRLSVAPTTVKDL